MMKLGYKRVASPVAYCALSIKAGTRNEKPHLNGLAHLTEHMLFKGTKKRRAVTINNLLEKLGGELNAYTTKEETVIHATVLKEDLRRAIELIADLVFNPLFPEREFLKEKEVVIDEILSYKDSPSDLIFDDFDTFIFKEHPLANNILGTRRSVKRITIEDMKSYIDEYYKAENMSLSVVADIDYDACFRMASRFFPLSAHLGDKFVDSYMPLSYDGSPFLARVESMVVRKKRKTYQSHCIVGGRAYNLYDERRLPFAVLVNMLGGPAVNSILNQSLREKYGLAYSVEASFVPYSDTGLYTIYFGTDKKDVDRCVSLVDKEIKSLVSSEMSAFRLRSAKKQLLGQLTIAIDNAEAQCLNIGKSLLVYGKTDSFEELRGKIELITSSDLKRVAEEIFAEQNRVTLLYE